MKLTREMFLYSALLLAAMFVQSEAGVEVEQQVSELLAGAGDVSCLWGGLTGEENLL